MVFVPLCVNDNVRTYQCDLSNATALIYFSHPVKRIFILPVRFGAILDHQLIDANVLTSGKDSEASLFDFFYQHCSTFL